MTTTTSPEVATMTTRIAAHAWPTTPDHTSPDGVSPRRPVREAYAAPARDLEIATAYAHKEWPAAVYMVRRARDAYARGRVFMVMLHGPAGPVYWVRVDRDGRAHDHTRRAGDALRG